MTTTSIKNEYATFWIKDDILFVVYNDNIKLTEVVARKMISDLLEFQHGKLYPYLIDISGVQEFNQEARNYLSIHRQTITPKVALLARNKQSGMIASFYVHVNQPVGVTQIFSDEASALDFLTRPK